MDKRPARFTNIDRRTTSDQVYERLRDSITRGQLPGGSVLSQMELADQFGVSRVPVREALRRLQAERLLTGRPFQRYVVLAPSAPQVRELLDIRQELELLAARRLLADQEALAEALAEARAVLASMALREPYDSWIAKDRAFHRLLNGSDSEVARIVDESRLSIQQFLKVTEIPIERRLDQLAEHRALLDSLEARDVAGVEAAVRAHIGATRAQFELRMTESPAPPDESAPSALSRSDRRPATA